MMIGERMAKRSSIGKSIRKRLSDITNHQPQPKSPLVFDQMFPVDASSSATKEYIDHLLKENAGLMKLIVEKKKTIETNGVELQRLRVIIQKTQLQNRMLAQSNSHMMAELNIGKQKLKALQHELTCKDALFKTTKLELQAQREMNEPKCESKMKDIDNVDTNQQNANRRIRPTRNQSIGPMTTSQKVSDEELVENKRRCVRRQTARFRSQEHEPNENLFEIKDLKMHEDGPTSHKVSDEEIVENKRRCVTRQSARFISHEKEHEPNENLCEITNHKLHEDGPTIEPEHRESQRMSLGRPSRRAAEKIQSYKEVPINIKMRRPV